MRAGSILSKVQIFKCSAKTFDFTSIFHEFMVCGQAQLTLDLRVMSSNLSHTISFSWISDSKSAMIALRPRRQIFWNQKNLNTILHGGRHDYHFPWGFHLKITHGEQVLCLLPHFFHEKQTKISKNQKHFFEEVFKIDMTQCELSGGKL